MTAAMAISKAMNMLKYVATDTQGATCLVPAVSDWSIVGHQEECNARFNVDLADISIDLHQFV